MYVPRTCLFGALVATVGVVCGCSGSQFGADPRVPVSERHVIAAGSPAGQNLSLPTDRGFNIHVKQSSQDLGSAGQARGTSDATPAGQAFAEATAAKGGSAKAEFKLGHRIDNDGSSSQSMAAQIAFGLKQKVGASSPPSAETSSKAELWLLVIDSRKRVVSKTVIVQANSDDSTGSASLPQQRDLTARLEPGESYDLVLYGHVEASTADQQEATARLDIEGLQVKLMFSPVATRPAAENGR